jgi:hypothetical protein
MTPHDDGFSFVERVRQRQQRERQATAAPTSAEFWDYCDSLEKERRRKQTSAEQPVDAAKPGRNPAYVTKAIHADLERLANAHEGTRNHTLHAVACNVFEFVKGGHANEPAARAEMERIAHAIGLPHNEIQATLRSAWNKVGPRYVPPPGGAS